jgi:hypothetical protein
MHFLDYFEYSCEFVKYVLDRVNRRDGYYMKKPFRSSARGASFHSFTRCKLVLGTLSSIPVGLVCVKQLFQSCTQLFWSKNFISLFLVNYDT